MIPCTAILSATFSSIRHFTLLKALVSSWPLFGFTTMDVCWAGTHACLHAHVYAPPCVSCQYLSPGARTADDPGYLIEQVIDAMLILFTLEVLIACTAPTGSPSITKCLYMILFQISAQ